MPSISIVIAVYNEEETLRAVFERCLAVLKDCCDDYEILILDDGSADHSLQIAESLAEQYPDVTRVLRHEVNLGIARTFEDLFKAATKELIFDVPSDGEYPPEALYEILPMMSEYDIVVCRRTTKNYSVYRKIVSYWYRMLPKLLFSVDMYDPGSTKCRKQKVIREISVKSKGVFIEAERMLRAVRRGYRLGKVDIVPDRRLAGDPRGADFAVLRAAVIDLFRLWIEISLYGDSYETIKLKHNKQGKSQHDIEATSATCSGENSDNR